MEEIKAEVSKTPALIEKTQVCKCCGRKLPMHEFPHNFRFKDGYSRVCKECTEKSKQERKDVRNKERREMRAEIRSSHITTKPGIKATFRIADFKDDMLFAELKRRGYKGELKYVREVII